MLLQQKLWGVIWVLNLTQMVITIRKQLIVIIFIISAQLFFNKIAKKPFRGTVPVVGHALLLGVCEAGPHPDGHGHPETS